MQLAFPSFDHVPLRNSPLREVVCQVRFPVILRIAQETPVDFQEAVRSRFPNLQTEQELRVELALGQPARPAGAKPPVHRFFDKNEIRMVSLGADFYAVSTTQYESWQAFSDDLRFATEAVLSVYEVQYSTRIGLRYINMLNTANTRTDSFDPSVLDMLRPELTALLRREEIGEPHLALTHIRVRHEDGTLSFRSGIVQNEDEQERQFLLDFDQYTEDKIDLQVDDLLARCDRYHALIYNAFRWCIAPSKLAVFEPVE